MIKMYIGHVKCNLFLSDFNETLIFSIYFQKKKKKYISSFIKIRPVGAELFHAGGQMDRQTWRR
jgi:hypothetical protein